MIGSVCVGLRAHRRRLGLTQCELGRLVDRPQSVISRWESSDRAMTPGDLRDVARALELGVDELLGEVVPRDRRRRSSRARPSGERTRLGRALASIRGARRADPVAVAATVGISPYRLWRIEGGVDMTLYEFAGLCRALGVSPARVLDAITVSIPAARSGRATAIGPTQAWDLTTVEIRHNSPGASLKTE